jgi:nucleoside 2-deoxyribosyltransferase
LDNKIYVAGPLFAIHERTFLETIVTDLSRELRLDPHRDFFLPHRDAGDVGIAGRTNDTVFLEDMRHLEGCEIVVALLDGTDVDSGTAVELGYAYAKGKEIFGLLTDFRRWNGLEIGMINNMIWGICRNGTRIFKNTKTLAEAIKSHMAMNEKSEVRR